MTRQEAREEIVKKANKITSVGSNRILKMKNINEAVKIVRFHRLVSNDILEAAGFNKMKGV